MTLQALRQEIINRYIELKKEPPRMEERKGELHVYHQPNDTIIEKYVKHPQVICFEITNVISTHKRTLLASKQDKKTVDGPVAVCVKVAQGEIGKKLAIKSLAQWITNTDHEYVGRHVQFTNVSDCKQACDHL